MGDENMTNVIRISEWRKSSAPSEAEIGMAVGKCVGGDLQLLYAFEEGNAPHHYLYEIRADIPDKEETTVLVLLDDTSSLNGYRCNTSQLESKGELLIHLQMCRNILGHSVHYYPDPGVLTFVSRVCKEPHKLFEVFTWKAGDFLRAS